MEENNQEFGTRRIPIRRKYKSELELCQEALNTVEAEKKIWRSVCVLVILLALGSLFCFLSALKGNLALQRTLNDSKLSVTPKGISLTTKLK